MRKLRMGMVGGGKDAFIGAIHRYALNMDGLIELSCGKYQPRHCKRFRAFSFSARRQNIFDL